MANQAVETTAATPKTAGRRKVSSLNFKPSTDAEIAGYSKKAEAEKLKNKPANKEFKKTMAKSMKTKSGKEPKAAEKGEVRQRRGRVSSLDKDAKIKVTKKEIAARAGTVRFALMDCICKHNGKTVGEVLGKDIKGFPNKVGPSDVRHAVDSGYITI